jgi:predicted transcriptional regulator
MATKSTESKNSPAKNNQGLIPIIRGKHEGYTYDTHGARGDRGSPNKPEVQQFKGFPGPPISCPLIGKYCTPHKYLPCPYCTLEAKILIILRKEMPKGTPELAEILEVESNKARQTCYRLGKKGWVTSRKLSSGKGLNYFPITGEVATREKRMQFYNIICKLHSLINSYKKSFRAIENYFNSLLKSGGFTKKQKERIKEFMKKLKKTLETSGIDDALYMVGLIPFPPKTLYWNLKIYTSKNELDKFLQAA